jgi:glucoamylase
MSSRAWLARACAGAALAALCVTSVTGCAAPAPRLLLGGITADHSAPDGIRVLPASPGSPAGGVSPAAGASPDNAALRWLRAGSVPGSTPALRQMAEGALVDLRLLTRPDGAVAAAWYGEWKFAWPRDDSWAAAAFAATGHPGESLRVLRFLARVQYPSGRWAAKYTLSGTPVVTGPGSELDACGWFPWAVWIWYSDGGRGVARQRELAALWPAVRLAADAAAASLSRGGLPPPSPDYWEDRTSQPTIGTAGPLLAGLRAAVRLATGLRDESDARRWAGAAARLDQGIRTAYSPEFNRFPDGTGGLAEWLALFGAGPGPTGGGLAGGRPAGGRAAADGLAGGGQPGAWLLNGPDAAVTFLGPPFGPPDAAVSAAVARAARILTLRNGGILPGTTWRGDRSVAWTPETGFFALYDASTGRLVAARTWLNWLAAHRTADGALPEQVSASGQPVSVAPLDWTCAIVLLALTAMRHPLPIP